MDSAQRLDRDGVATDLDALFAPRSVAVIGASRDPGSLGFRTLNALVSGRFQGPVYPVNPKATYVGSIRAYPSVEAIPDVVDLAILLVPRDAVAAVAAECGAKGVKALVVITAGFAETGAEGKKLQDDLLALVRRHGMRMVGPNCMGLINTDPLVQLNASFAPDVPPQGGIAMLSQSGALGLAILRLARNRRVGLSSFVSVGNKADVSGNDMLEHWEDDDRTRVILLYLESFGNPSRFAQIARRVTRKKPVVAVKGGRTVAGQRAAGSHTAALAGSDAAADAMFRQTGVLRAQTLNEMFDIALGLDTQPLPPGNRVGIVTNAGGPGILCADACVASGLLVEELSDATRTAIAAGLPGVAGLSNPVDMVASADPAAYQHTITHLLTADEIDAVIAVFIPVESGRDEEYLAGIGAGLAAARPRGGKGKPFYLCMMTERGDTRATPLGDEIVPAYPFPEQAARALARVWDYAVLRSEPVGRVVRFPDARIAEARAVCQAALQHAGAGWLSASDTGVVLETAGLVTLRGGFATDSEQAVEIASEVGYPVAVKLASTSLVHKTEIGGVRLGLADAAAVRRAYGEIRERLAALGQLHAMDGVAVQAMATGGVEVMLGMSRDRQFGPLVTFGLGGIHVEVLRDVAFRVAPVTDLDAAAMVREIRGHVLLEGYRGHDAADMPALEEALQRLSRLVEGVPEIEQMDLNPVFALPPGLGCAIADARIRVATGSV